MRASHPDSNRSDELNEHPRTGLSAFIREQELMRVLIAKSRLPSLTVDLSDNNITAAVERMPIGLKRPADSICQIKNGVGLNLLGDIGSVL